MRLILASQSRFRAGLLAAGKLAAAAALSTALMLAVAGPMTVAMLMQNTLEAALRRGA